jgi:hypothetical protein
VGKGAVRVKNSQKETMEIQRGSRSLPILLTSAFEGVDDQRHASTSLSAGKQTAHIAEEVGFAP